MDPSNRVVIEMPLAALWTSDGPLRATRAGRVGEAEIARLLRETKATFIIAKVGLPLRQIEPGERYDFWKQEVRRRLVARDADAIRHDDFPGSYCYVASEWREDGGGCLILLETYD